MKKEQAAIPEAHKPFLDALAQMLADKLLENMRAEKNEKTKNDLGVPHSIGSLPLRRSLVVGQSFAGVIAKPARPSHLSRRET